MRFIIVSINLTVNFWCLMGQYGSLCLFSFFSQSNNKYIIIFRKITEKVWMLCQGFKPATAGWYARMAPWDKNLEAKGIWTMNLSCCKQPLYHLCHSASYVITVWAILVPDMSDVYTARLFRHSDYLDTKWHDLESPSRHDKQDNVLSNK